MAKADSRKSKRIDPSWPEAPDGEHPVSELAADRQGALSPYGEVTFPLEAVPYEHPETEINRSA
ncbi:hypothetical protein [Prauserella cavernicola]|uniref:Uncharacterized protein n=1 Tax=Prauserella cavernicola TaxID=2800127 RepID=A0A934V668_9PSEU|nr:hypothetical protein [Prauserella cavernicola]MBK1785368.1 hypothetical protein [Prauserella cavernicola]